MYSFFAMMARMKNIERWALMRNSIQENISEHSLEVAMLAHGLSLIANEKCGKHVDSNEIALIASKVIMIFFFILLKNIAQSYLFAGN